MPNPTDRARIGQTDLTVTRLGLGSAPIGNLLQEVPEADAEGAFEAALSTPHLFMVMVWLKTASAVPWPAKTGTISWFRPRSAV